MMKKTVEVPMYLFVPLVINTVLLALKTFFGL